MRPIFCVDVTVNKKNEEINGAELIAARVSEETAVLRERASHSANSLAEKSGIPFYLTVAKYLLFGAFFLIVGTAAAVAIEQGLATVWGNAPLLIVIGFFCGLAALGILLYEKSKRTAVEESGEAGRVIASLEEVEALVYKELAVPDNAPTVDVLVFNYKVKEDGSIKAVPMQMLPYLLFEGRLFTREGKLAIADWDLRYEIPLEGLQSICKVERSVTIPTLLWSKPVSWTDESYKPFRIREMDGNLVMKHHYVLRFIREGEECGIYFPPYELPAFEAATGLTVSE